MSQDHYARLLAFDQKNRGGFSRFLAGIDEVGRGPLAGPVVAAAVMFIRAANLEGLNDSKKVSPERRQRLFKGIAQNALIGIGVVSEAQIDSINIYQASRLAMKEAVLSLTRTPDLLFIDGKMKLDLPISQKSFVKGDAKSASIAAASIVAKVYRDALMIRFDEMYPSYGFGKHKGYATAYHLEKIKAFGPSPIHRKSFFPISQFYSGSPS